MNKSKKICSVCRKIKELDSFKYGNGDICTACWQVIRAENFPKIKPLKRKPVIKRVIDPTIQIKKMRENGCTCSSSHLLLLFNKKTALEFIHLPSCSLFKDNYDIQ